MASTTYKWPAMTFIAYFFILKWRLLSVSIQDARWPKKNPTFPLSLKILQTILSLCKTFEEHMKIFQIFHAWKRIREWGKMKRGLSSLTEAAKRLIINFHPLLPSSFLPLHWFRTHPTVTSTTIVEVKAADFNSNPERLITSSSLAAKREELANWASFSQGA